MSTLTKTVGQINVLIIDDHPVVRDSVERLIESQPDMHVTATANTRKEVYAAFNKEAPDVAIVDVALADSHGLELIQDLRAQFETTRFVVFSMYDERLYAERAVKCGANGYVEKSQSAKMLLNAVRMANNDDYFISRPILSRILRQMGPDGSASESSEPFGNLTARELEVYQLIGLGQDATQIADKLSLSRKTIETYRRRIKEKFDLDSLTSLTLHAARWTDDQSKKRNRKR